MDNNVIGLDISKNVFHVVFINETGKLLKRKKLKRSEVSKYFANLPKSFIGIES